MDSSQRRNHLLENIRGNINEFNKIDREDRENEEFDTNTINVISNISKLIAHDIVQTSKESKKWE